MVAADGLDGLDFIKSVHTVFNPIEKGLKIVWIKRNRELCEGCGILLTPFYAIPEDQAEIFLCPECEAEEI